MTRMDSKMVVRSGKRVVGIYDAGSFTFRKEVYRKKHGDKGGHFMWKLKSWGIQDNVVQILEGLGCKNVEIYIKDEGRVITAPFILYVRAPYRGNFGAGPQRFLPEEMFDEVKRESVKAFEQGPMK